MRMAGQNEIRPGLCQRVVIARLVVNDKNRRVQIAATKQLRRIQPSFAQLFAAG